MNALWPDRNRRSDGTIGDTAHQGRKSDHNPNSAGVVTAFDITHDPASGASMHTLTEWLRLSQDRRIKYVIWNRRLFSSYSTASRQPWQWGPYTGSTNPHTTHAHVSVSADHRLYDDMSSWQLGDDVADPRFDDETAVWLNEFVGEARRMGSNSGRDYAHWLLKLFRGIRDVFTDN